MTYSEMKKMCEDIDYYAGHKLKPDDAYEFKKFYNRIKDDEDLDSLSQEKLRKIHDTYLKK